MLFCRDKYLLFGVEKGFARIVVIEECMVNLKLDNVLQYKMEIGRTSGRGVLPIYVIIYMDFLSENRCFFYKDAWVIFVHVPHKRYINISQILQIPFQ